MIECQTLELVKLNQKITDAHNEVINMSDRSIQELIDDIRTEIYPLFKISESIAMLDMIASFAQLVTTKDYVKPELTDTLAIKAGRHPIRDKIQIEQYIPNDVYATQQHRFQIVTGCNMSGKSTYIRSIALMTVMAQIGCFVPAQYASFPICHQLFARVSTDDNVEANVFAAEMREIAFILRNVERRSLVIVDELGRGTSTTDGLAIAIAIAEALIESRAYVWFVTHFRDLARILAERAGVVNLHLAVEISVHSPKMKMLYKISDGYEEEKYYGLALARVVDLPENVITTATKVSKVLHQHEEARKSNAKVLSVARRRKLILGLREQLIQAKNGSMEGDELRQWLKRLQDEFLVRMAAIDAEAATALAKEQEESTESNQKVEFSPSEKLEQQGYQESRNRRMDSCSVRVGTHVSFVAL
jgi:DNA mismatch repair protein MSH4